MSNSITKANAIANILGHTRDALERHENQPQVSRLSDHHETAAVYETICRYLSKELPEKVGAAPRDVEVIAATRYLR